MNAKKKKSEAVFEVYREGLCFMSVCTDMTPEEAETFAQTVRPSGTKRGWKLSEDKTFRTGEPNPCPCEKHTGRIHILLDC